MQNQQLDFLDLIAIISFIIQLQNVQKHDLEISNDEIMRELQRQDREYLETVIDNQKKILSLLENIQTK